MYTYIHIDMYTYIEIHMKSTRTAHGRDHALNIWISRSLQKSVRSFVCRGLRLLIWKFAGNFGDSRDNVFDMYGDSRENLLETLAVVIILSTISSIRGTHKYIYVCIYTYTFLAIARHSQHTYTIHIQNIKRNLDT